MKAQSQIIVTVLIILLILALIVIVWVIVQNMIQGNADDIDVDPFGLDAELNYYLENNKSGVFSVKRGAGGGNISEVRLIFTLSNGSTISYLNDSLVPGELETTTYYIKSMDLGLINFLDVESVAVHYGYGEDGVTGELDSATEGSKPDPDAECVPLVCGTDFGCGDNLDGCGSVLECGDCSSGVCSLLGRCYTPSDDDGDGDPDCTPNCGGKECGRDGCGGSCGSCAGDEICADGDCIDRPIVVHSDCFGDRGDGVYEICTCDDLQRIDEVANLDKDYILMNDIECSEITNFNPIGDNDNKFEGNFDGDNFVISDLTINMDSENFVGLFGYINLGANIHNVGLTNVDITGKGYVGGLVGNLGGGEIRDCSSTGDVSGSNYVGGLVGYCYGGDIYNSFSTVDISGSSSSIGGLVGSVGNGNIYNSYATGDVSGSNYVGGLVGYYYKNTIYNSYATGDVSGSNYVGGLVGRTYRNIYNSYATGNISANNNYVGGLIGESSGEINNSYAIGDVSGSNYAGGLVGKHNNGEKIINSYYYNSDNNPAYCSGSDLIGSPECSHIGNLDYFYSLSNPPMDSWTPGEWVEVSDSYPVLSWQ